MQLRWIGWAALAGLLVAALLDSAALVFATLTAAALASLITVARRHIFRGFTFERTPARRVIPWGGSLEVTVSATNAKLLPIFWLRVFDSWPAGLEPQGFALTPSLVGRSQSLVQTFSLRWFERVRRHYRVRCTKRGLHRFGPAEIEADDPFGIARVVRTIDARPEILVLPRVLPVPDLSALAGRPLVDAPADRSLARDPTELRGIREYRAGDPLRAVNWRATARRSTLHTNEFEPTALGAVRLLLDVGVMEYVWQGLDPDRIELLCVVAASLATALAERGYGVGLACNAHLATRTGVVDIEAREGALDEVLEHLARIPMAPSDDFGVLLRAELTADDDADRLIVAPTLRPAVRALIPELRAERPTSVVFVGTPTEEEATLVDAVVPAGFAWREQDVLTLAV